MVNTFKSKKNLDKYYKRKLLNTALDTKKSCTEDFDNEKESIRTEFDWEKKKALQEQKTYYENREKELRKELEDRIVYLTQNHTEKLEDQKTFHYNELSKKAVEYSKGIGELRKSYNQNTGVLEAELHSLRKSHEFMVDEYKDFKILKDNMDLTTDRFMNLAKKLGDSVNMQMARIYQDFSVLRDETAKTVNQFDKGKFLRLEAASKESLIQKPEIVVEEGKYEQRGV